MFIDEDLIDEIGTYLGFEMWNTKDETKEYDFPGAREEHSVPGEAFVEGNVFFCNNTQLLVYKNKECYQGYKSLYTLNLSTLKPTKNSKIQTLLSPELLEKIKIKNRFVV
jgi:hypothetical protein